MKIGDQVISIAKLPHQIWFVGKIFTVMGEVKGIITGFEMNGKMIEINDRLYPTNQFKVV